MPNWNNNSVTIDAPISEVKTWLVAGNDGTYSFNMHRLFPEKVPADDPTGDATWNYDWYVENTGSKWPPEVYIDNDRADADETMLSYDTARAPNNLTLQRLYQLTGWTIVNEFEEPGGGFEGTFRCDEHGVTDEEWEYQTRCEVCERKQPSAEYTADPEASVCDGCWYVTTIS